MGKGHPIHDTKQTRQDKKKSDYKRDRTRTPAVIEKRLKKRKQIETEILIRKNFDWIIWQHPEWLKLSAQELIKRLKATIKANSGKTVFQKTLNLYPEVWHPKRREEDLLVPSTYGLVRGAYHPSNESQGIILLHGDLGVLPVDLAPELSNRAKRRISESTNPKEYYQVQIESTEATPHYRLIIQNRTAYQARQRLKDFQFRIVGEVISSAHKSLVVRTAPDNTVKIYRDKRRHKAGDIVLVKARWDKNGSGLWLCLSSVIG